MTMLHDVQSQWHQQKVNVQNKEVLCNTLMTEMLWIRTKGKKATIKAIVDAVSNHSIIKNSKEVKKTYKYVQAEGKNSFAMHKQLQTIIINLYNTLQMTNPARAEECIYRRSNNRLLYCL